MSLKIKPFYVVRHEDVSGKSGTGIVAVGAVFPSGIAIMEWLSFTTALTQFRSIEHLSEVHSHEGRTEVVFGNPPDDSVMTKVENSETPKLKPKRKRKE